MLTTIKVNIDLFKGKKKRSTPFYTGYRPMFELVNQSRISGRIRLIAREELYPGESSYAYIDFISNLVLNIDFIKGQEFFFFEGKEPLGKIQII